MFLLHHKIFHHDEKGNGHWGSLFYLILYIAAVADDDYSNRNPFTQRISSVTYPRILVTQSHIKTAHLTILKSDNRFGHQCMYETQDFYRLQWMKVHTCGTKSDYLPPRHGTKRHCPP